MADPWATALDMGLTVITLVLSVLGAIAFFRQSKAKRVRYLTESVLRPLSKVVFRERRQSSAGGRPDEELFLLVPVKAAEDVDPTVEGEGLRIEDLPGIADGLRFLRRPPLFRFLPSQRELRSRCSRALKEWNIVRDLMQKHAMTRERRRGLLETMIAGDMTKTYPNLPPVVYQDNETVLNVYYPEGLLGAAEINCRYLRPDWVVHVTARPSQQGGVSILEVDESWAYLHLARMSADNSIAAATESEFRRLITSLIEDIGIQGATREMAQHRGELESALDRYRDSMRDLTFGLNLEFRAAE